MPSTRSNNGKRLKGGHEIDLHANPKGRVPPSGQILVDVNSNTDVITSQGDSGLRLLIAAGVVSDENTDR
jgi:hypothetical protein